MAIGVECEMDIIKKIGKAIRIYLLKGKEKIVVKYVQKMVNAYHVTKMIIVFMRDINVKNLFWSVEIIQLKIVKKVRLLIIMKLVFMKNVTFNILNTIIIFAF